MWTALNFAPGVWKDDSPLKAMGRYIDADKVRFVSGDPNTPALPETIYGWERASTTILLGLCRGAFTWADSGRNAIAAFGTHLREYAMDADGTVTDITPAMSYSQASINFTTTLGSAIVTITGWTHGLVLDQKFLFENSTVASVGGVTINGAYAVREVLSATSVTFIAAQAATAAAGPTTATVDITSYLIPGQVDGLAGLGYGTGAYGSGGYGGGSSSYSLYPRTWSFNSWGQNLLSSPRGGAIYEWAPNYTSSELVTNGDFSSSAGWSSGTGWTITGGQAVATIGSASDLSTSVTTSTGAYHLLTVTVTRAAGGLTFYHGTSTIGSAALTGLYRLPFYTSGGVETLKITKDATFSGAVDNVSLKVLTTAQIVPNAPTQVGSMFVTAERIVVAAGSNLAGAFDPLQIDWSDAENNQNWTPANNNLAGGYTLPGGGRIVRGQRGSRENVIWTLESLWAMRFNGNPGSIYDLIEMGRQCGLIGPNAAACVGSTWEWMTPSGAFYAYDGSTPRMLPCTLSRDVKDNLAYVQQDKVYATSLVGKNYAEIWWFYPDIRDGNECSRYVIHDLISGTWSCGMFDRTAYIPASTFEFPLAVGYSPEDYQTLTFTGATGTFAAGATISESSTIFGIALDAPTITDTHMQDYGSIADAASTFTDYGSIAA